MIFLVERVTITSSLAVIPFTTQIDGSTEYTNAGAFGIWNTIWGKRLVKGRFGLDLLSVEQVQMFSPC